SSPAAAKACGRPPFRREAGGGRFSSGVERGPLPALAFPRAPETGGLLLRQPQRTTASRPALSLSKNERGPVPEPAADRGRRAVSRGSARSAGGNERTKERRFHAVTRTRGDHGSGRRRPR